MQIGIPQSALVGANVFGPHKQAKWDCSCGVVQAMRSKRSATAIELEYQCARYDEASANCDDLRAFDFHTL